ncbi:Tn7-like element transposition protein TnsE [Lysinibacillus sp. FSL K6-0057]|uniref:Tn7-like element transposition protein TnsE n=1 Tax=Lysinibacillus sp. FSL K6-0057 TaxID=2921411 RepID=UPI00315A2E8D
MSEQPVKLQHWPFNKEEQAQLIWISSPFWHEKKIMIYVYFRANGKTEKVLADWGTLPALAIQHYYMGGDITKSIPPQGINEIELTIYPNSVSTHERNWQVQGTNDKDVSRSFGVKQGNKYYTLPVIEVVRSILAPNRFLLYRLFEMNSFPQYFIENYYPDKIHLDFSSLYNIKYTKTTFLYQLVWLITNRDLRNVFENVAYTFNQKGTLKFDWSFTNSITIRAIVKPNAIGGTVLRVISVKNKQIPYKEITYEHPEIAQSTKANEPKKYTLQTKKNLTGQQDEIILDEEIKGTTDDFDVIEMDNQMHEYIEMPKVTKIPRRTNKKREFENENTKKRFINADSKRSTADVGGNQVARGLEQQSLIDIQIEGELGEFIKVMRVLQDFPELQSINIIQGSLKEFSDTKRFVYLSDGLMERKYVIAEVRLFSGKVVNVIEVEREEKAISTFIYFSNRLEDKLYELNVILKGLIDNNGVWDKAQLSYKRINYLTLRHGKKQKNHRAKLLERKIEELSRVCVLN